MELLGLLKTNKGTVSSALGKELAQEVLNGDTSILNDAIVLTSYEPENKKSKHIRAGAAKIVEKVAEIKPELIANELEKLLPALNMPEPQTRWMIIMVFGYCAELNLKVAIQGIDFAKKYIKEKSGVCLSGAAHRYLGYIGNTSSEIAGKVLPILIDALHVAEPNEVDWIFEAFIKMFAKLSKNDQKLTASYAKNYMDAPKKSTIKRIEKLIKMNK